MIPRVKDVDPGSLEIGHVTRNHCHAMDQCSRGNQTSPFGAGVGHMELGATEGYSRIDRQGPIGKFGNDMTLHPYAQPGALVRVAALYQEDTKFNFHQCQS